MGTPQLAVPVLEKLIESRHDVVLVVTTPDKPSGRRQRLTASPIKELALKKGLPIAQPATLKDENFRKLIEEIKPDAGVVFAYGKIIPKWLLDLPRFGVINVHPSLLPKWRGAAPIQRSIMAGDTKTGVTIIQMAPELDAGDILLQEELAIDTHDTSETLMQKISRLAPELVIETLDGFEAGTMTPRKQDEAQVTFADKIVDEDLEINWDASAKRISEQVRGLNPKPGAVTGYNDNPLKVWMVEPAPADLPLSSPEAQVPGTVIYIDKSRGPYILTQTEPLLLSEVQPANKKKMTGAEFVRGYRLKVGDRLGGR